MGCAPLFHRWIAAWEAGAPQWNFHKYLIGADGELSGIAFTGRSDRQPDHRQDRSPAAGELRSGGNRLDLADRGGAGGGQLRGARECSDRQHLAFAADLDLALRKRGKVEPGARHGLLGHDELAGKVLGQAFEPARGIDGVADRSDRDRVPIPISPTMVGPQ